jgi:hypothetical protein
MQRHLLASWRLAWASAWLTAAALASAQTGIQPSNPPPRIPLVPGLTIVTAIAQPTGDYESIKRVLAVDAQSVLLHYSAQYVATDALGAIEPDGKLTRTEVRRRVLRADLEKSTIYLQQFDGRTPELVAGATAIGTSRQVLRDLKSTGKSDITVYQASIGLGPPNPLDRQPGEIDYRLPGTLERKAPYPAWVGLIVNDRPVMLPAVRATGVPAIVDSDFHFLDDEANPLTLRFDIGKSQLRVIRITYPVSAETSGAAGAGAAPAPNTRAGAGPGPERQGRHLRHLLRFQQRRAAPRIRDHAGRDRRRAEEERRLEAADQWPHRRHRRRKLQPRSLTPTCCGRAPGADQPPRRCGCPPEHGRPGRDPAQGAEQHPGRASAEPARGTGPPGGLKG